jgi:hypothetical protein
MKMDAERWRQCAWLRELALRWHDARGRGGVFSRAFSRDWEELLEFSRLTSAELRAEACREARQLKEAGFIDLKTDRYRPYQIERVILPFASETALRDIFGLPPETGALSFDPEKVEWARQLEFVRTNRISVLAEDLLRLNDFFAKSRDSLANRPIIPIKERSLQIFGDEKRLDALLTTSLFRPDRLTLAALRCEQVGEPLGWKRGPACGAHKPILVIENAATWHSYARWNSAAGEFSSVVYGRGFQCADSVQYLRDILDELDGVREILYFGDLDPLGLKIPQQASAYAQAYALPEIRPHLRSYENLLDHAGQAKPWEGEPAMRTDCEWLGRLADRAWNLLESGKRLPQEFVGFEELQSLQSAANR